MIQADVCIVGAGPGGTATALKLSYLGIPSILIDKATFPRDKVCGDAISGKVTTLMSRLDPDMLKRFNENAEPIDVWGIRFVAPNLKALDIPFKPNYIKEEKSAPGYVSKRMDFDNFLIEEVRRRDNITFYESTEVTSIKRSQRGYRISTKGNNVLEVDSKLLIVANGAYSSFSRKQAGLEKDPKHYAAAVRAYYKNVKGLSADNFIELHFIKAITPGYFWIFPLPNGEANVGLGMRSDILAKRKVNLKKSFKEVVEEHPMFKERFKDAEVLTKLEGYGLPLGSKRRGISGDHFMLVGDAGHLVDPLTGEGIGNAFYSGFIAAEQVQKCLEVENYSAEFLRAYDVRVSRVLGSEMRLSYRLQRMLMYPWIVNLIANIIASNKKIINVISGMYNDFDLREQLVKPIFWVKMWFK